jgi:REP element-mobilizing transposase RayT
MDLKILIVTPDRSLGEQILLALKHASYVPLLAQTIAEASFISQYENYSIAIIDCDLSEPGPAYLATELRNNLPDIRSIFIHKKGVNPDELGIHKSKDLLLPRPFFMPDLLEVVNLWFSDEKFFRDIKVTEANQSKEKQSDECSKVNLAFDHALPKTDAEVVIVLNNDLVKVYAGQLSRSVVNEIGKTILDHYKRGETDDLTLFFNLGSSGNEYTIYAKKLRENHIVALAYKKDVPFSVIRNQVVSLARCLPVAVSENLSERLKPRLDQISDHHRSKNWIDQDQAIPITEDWFPDQADENESIIDVDFAERQQAMVDDFLNNLDIPEPDVSDKLKSKESDIIHSRQKDLSNKFPEPVEQQNHQEENLDQRPSTELQPLDAFPAANANIETESFAIYDLAYSCVLIPRLPDHKLEGVLKNLLKVEVARLCLAFGFRLEKVDVQTEYINWVVSVRPKISVLQVIKVIREQTSLLIFREYSRIKIENPSGDFWAPGYIIIHGRNLISGSILKRFINQTRTRQGVEMKTRENNA